MPGAAIRVGTWVAHGVGLARVSTRRRLPVVGRHRSSGYRVVALYAPAGGTGRPDIDVRQRVRASAELRATSMIT